MVAQDEDRRSVPLPPGGNWHQHAFAPQTDRPKSCLVCGRERVWRWHFGPFLPARRRRGESVGG